MKTIAFAVALSLLSATVAASPPDRQSKSPVALSVVSADNCLDPDGNGQIDALTDGIIILRSMFGLTGTAVTQDVIGDNATRTTWPEIRDFFNTYCGTAYQ